MLGLLLQALAPAAVLGAVAGLRWQSWAVGLAVALAVLAGELFIVWRFVRMFA